jgi:hypothetical protein
MRIPRIPGRRSFRPYIVVGKPCRLPHPAKIGRRRGHNLPLHGKNDVAGIFIKSTTILFFLIYQHSSGHQKTGTLIALTPVAPDADPATGAAGGQQPSGYNPKTHRQRADRKDRAPGKRRV